MATIKQFTVTVTNVTDKDNPFIAEKHIVRAKSKAEAADEVWDRLEKELFETTGVVSRDHVEVKKFYKINVDLTKQLSAAGYQTRNVREQKKAEARRKAAQKKAAQKAAQKSGTVRKSTIAA